MKKVLFGGLTALILGTGFALASDSKSVGQKEATCQCANCTCANCTCTDCGNGACTCDAGCCTEAAGCSQASASCCANH